MYQHTDFQGDCIDLPVGKTVCVGRNYVDHIAELNNEIPREPVLFIKPSTSLCSVSEDILIPTQQGECHNEIEVAILISDTLGHASMARSLAGIWGVGVGLDLTLRDLQHQLKQKGLPWERAKSFDNACPLSGFVPLAQVNELDNLHFSLSVNGVSRQSASTQLMIWNMGSLLAQISSVFTLLPGDIVMTGTPKGVGPLKPNDKLELSLGDHFSIATTVKGRANEH